MGGKKLCISANGVADGSFEVVEVYVKSEKPLAHHIAVRGHPTLRALLAQKLSQQLEEVRLTQAFDECNLSFESRGTNAND